MAATDRSPLRLSKHEGAGNDFLVAGRRRRRAGPRSRAGPRPVRPAPGARRRRRHLGRAPGRGRRALDGAAQRRRGPGRDERERHPLPGPGGGGRRPGGPAPLHGGHRGRASAPSSTTRATARAGPGPASTWGWSPWVRTSPRSSADRRARRVDVGNPHLVLLGPDPAGVDVGVLGPRLEAVHPGGINVEFVSRRPAGPTPWCSGSGSAGWARPWPVAPGAAPPPPPPAAGGWSGAR